MTADVSDLALRVHLLGRFSVERFGRTVPGLEAARVQELFAFLLLNGQRPHPREALASLLWGESSVEQGRKYLRQTLWQLQGALEASGPHRPLLRVESDWVSLDPDAPIWLDVVEFERVVSTTQGVAGSELAPGALQALSDAVGLYVGDLLDGWYQDWCLFERDRLQNLYLVQLDKLMVACETQHQYEAGLAFGARLLRCDPARERTHRRLMRLHYLAGDRTSALRQYQRCAAVLQDELGVAPGRRTAELYRQIRADCGGADAQVPIGAASGSLALLLTRLQDMQLTLSDIVREVKDEVAGGGHAAG